MKKLEIQGHKFLYDREQTELNFTKYEKYSCSCQNCQDFFKVIDKILPKKFIDLLNQLGVDYRKPMELWSTYNAETYEEDYVDWGGWYNFTGTIVDEDDNPKKDSISLQIGDDKNFHTVTIQNERVFCFIKEFEEEQLQLEFYWKGSKNILG